ncbi:MAG: apolipoprotein N-acyltransferase [Planctomycetota bacterium]|jgi:apolipoprotein N-acyltransferase
MEQKTPSKLLSFITTLWPMLTSAVLLTVIHPPLNVSWLAWAAWVPFMLACRPDISARRLMVCAYVAGLCFWFGNLYWLVIVTTPGYITFSFVQACYWPLLALSVRFVRQKKWSLFWAAPVIFVGAEAIQGWLFTGFSWYHLAHSQFERLRLIQICDIFGTLGLSVLIAMANGLLVNLILRKSRAAQAAGSKPSNGNSIGRLAPPRSHIIQIIAFHILLFGTIFYGEMRLKQSSQYQTDGPVLGSVQPNVPAYVKEEMDNAQEILDDLIADSEKCIDAGAALIAWPETMVLTPMNPFFVSSSYQGAPEARYIRDQILQLCRDNAFVLFGAQAITKKLDQVDQYNSAFLYRPDGTADPQIYHKNHLVPFGEFIPFRNIPWIYKLFMFFNPYDYDYSLTAGTEYTTFEIEADGQKYGFGVLICYEDTDPTVTRKLVLDESGQKKADWLVNISNDGWYVHFKERQVIPMVELAQRTAISVFRCVENRVGIIRSVNTGISCLIEPTGKIRNNFKMGNLPQDAMARQGVAGWFVDTMPIDSRVTIFSRTGRWLDIVLGMGWSIILLWSIYTSCKYRKSRVMES